VTDEPKDALPTKLPTGARVSRFGTAAIDYSVNKQLQDLIPKEVGSALLNVRIKSAGEERILTGVVATKFGDRWGMVLSGAVDLRDRRNYEVEILAVITP